MKIKNKLLTVLALSYSAISFASISISPNKQDVDSFISSFPNEKKELASYVMKNHDGNGCFILRSTNKNDQERVCGSVSKVVLDESGELVTLKIYGTSFTDDELIYQIY